jgi:hypothetical protein
MEQVDCFSTVPAVIELGRLHRTSERVPVSVRGGLDAPALRGPSGSHSRPAAGVVAPCSWQTDQGPSRCLPEPLFPHPGRDPADNVHQFIFFFCFLRNQPSTATRPSTSVT